MAVERNLAGIERDQPDHHIKGGGFAGAVRTQQSDNLAAFDFQGNILNDRACAKAFLQMTRRQRALAYRHRIRRRRAARAFFSDFPLCGFSVSAFGIAAGSHPSRCARRNLLRPHRSSYCLRARSLGKSTEKCSKPVCGIHGWVFCSSVLLISSGAAAPSLDEAAPVRGDSIARTRPDGLPEASAELCAV